jgi:hypothetical protein
MRAMRKGMALVVAAVGLLALTGCRSESVKQPTVRKDGRAHRLLLPDAMAEALRIYDTQYRWCTAEDFARASIAGYQHTATSAPFAVVTDFDGDGRQDVVLVGRAPGYTTTVAILAAPDGCKVVELSRAKLPMNAKTLPRWLSAKAGEGAPGFVELDETCAVEYTFEKGRFKNRLVNS